MPPRMNICVAGWYLEKFDDWYMSLFRLNKKYPVFVVSNKNSDYMKTIDLPYCVRENTGLEWGAYNHYLMNVWTGGATLFCHDDIVLNAVLVGDEVKPPEFVFDKIAESETETDQAYIFGSRAEDVENYSRHGRMVYMSHNFLTAAKKLGGFWFDEKNKGYTNIKDERLKDEFDCAGYNSGIISFHEQCTLIGGKVHMKMIIPAFDLAIRGEAANGNVVYGKWLNDITNISNAAEKKLHIGCGSNLAEGFVNIDLYYDGADIQADAKDLPFDDNSQNWVESHHMLEHVGFLEAQEVLKEWHRVLKPGGYVFVSVPDIISMIDLIRKTTAPELWDGLMESMYGRDEPGMAHKYGYCKDSIERLLAGIGFTDISTRVAIGIRPTPSLMAFAQKRSAT